MRHLALSAALALGLVASSTAQAQVALRFVASDHVSADVINKTGHEFSVRGIGKVRILKVATKKADGKACNIHLPSVARQIAQAKPAAGVVIKVKLKFVVYGDDDWGCRGAGEDCIADVVVKAI